MVSPAAPFKKKSESPNGGVKNEAWRFSAIRTANQTGSMPKASTTGTKIGTIINEISKKSIKKPSIKYLDF